MTKHVNIGNAKTQLSELVAAAMRGEEIIIDKAGAPQVKLVPVEAAAAQDREVIAASRKSAFGMYRDALKGFDTSIEAIKAERGDPEERFRRKFGPAD